MITIYSSGTTKGVRRPVQRKWSEIEDQIDVISSEFKVWSWLINLVFKIEVILPLDHIFGITVKGILDKKGYKYKLHYNLLKAKPTGNVLITTPRLAKIYFRRGYRPSIWVSGSEPIDFIVPKGIRVFQGYGLSETGIIAYNNPLGITHSDSVGKPIVEFKIIQEVLWVKPHGTWINTKDLVELDSRGYLYITGRQ